MKTPRFELIKCECQWVTVEMSWEAFRDFIFAEFQMSQVENFNEGYRKGKNASVDDDSTEE